MIERGGPLSLARQCALLGVSRSSQYYRPKGENAENLALMRRLDELHMLYPFYGSRQLRRHLRREGVTAGRHRIRRLMRLMGMGATYRRPRTSVASAEHRIFPYLLRGLAISRADQVWCADITYVPVMQGFFYLVAVMDWATRHVLAWRLSNTMDASFCAEALDVALGRSDSRDPQHRPGRPVHQRGVRGPGAGGGRALLDGRPGPLPRQHLHRTAVAVAEVRGGLPPRTPERAGCPTDHRLVDRLLQRGAPSLVPGRADAGRRLSPGQGGGVRERSPGRSGHALPKRRATTRGQATLQLYAARYTRQPAPAGRRETLRPPTEANTQRPLSSPEGGCQDRGPIPTEHIKKATEGSGKPAGVHLNFGNYILDYAANL